jgi:hypothetical protein
LFVWDGVLFPKGSLEVIPSSLQPIIGDFCNSGQSAARIGSHRVFGCSGSPTSGTHQSDFDNVGTLCMHGSGEKAACNSRCGTGGDKGSTTHSAWIGLFGSC